MAVAALPDGRRALSASADKTLKLWDLETGNPLAAFTADSGHFLLVRDVAPTRSSLPSDAAPSVRFVPLRNPRASPLFLRANRVLQ